MQTNDTGADRTGRQGKPEQNEAQEKNQTGLPPSNLSLSLFSQRNKLVRTGGRGVSYRDRKQGGKTRLLLHFVLKEIPVFEVRICGTSLEKIQRQRT